LPNQGGTTLTNHGVALGPIALPTLAFTLGLLVGIPTGAYALRKSSARSDVHLPGLSDKLSAGSGAERQGAIAQLGDPAADPSTPGVAASDQIDAIAAGLQAQHEAEAIAQAGAVVGAAARTVGATYDRDSIRTAIMGRSKQEVVAEFGSPYLTSESSDGSQMYYYRNIEVFDRIAKVRLGTVYVQFDEDGRATDVSSG
jgi:hypothetical protein